jgi:SAM-dependent methyltransferase
LSKLDRLVSKVAQGIAAQVVFRSHVGAQAVGTRVALNRQTVSINPNEADRARYNDKDVVAQYRSSSYLLPCEEHVFRSYVAAGSRVLDLGVGAGRTTPFLAARSGAYVGIDYSEAMIEACRERYPDLDFQVRDARDLSCFADGYFDAVVFSFNGLGHLYPDESRIACVKEVNRVLRQGGSFVFSLHNARSILARPSRASRGLAGTVAALVGAARASWERVSSRMSGGIFWTGRGFFKGSAHGGVTSYATVPSHVRPEVEGLGFELLEVLNEDYPKASFFMITRWYYYVFRKL